MLYFVQDVRRDVVEIGDLAKFDDRAVGIASHHATLRTWVDAENLAEAANRFAIRTSPEDCWHETTFVPVDRGRNVSPRYDVVPLFKVGEEVSKTINGDYYPIGKVARVSDGPLYRRIVVEGEDGATVFWRNGRSESWREGSWRLVRGVVDKRNPDF